MSDPADGPGDGPGDGPATGLEWVDPAELEIPEDPVGEAIRRANARYAVALATADGDALCGLFEPDGAIVDGAGPGAAGHDGLRAMARYARERYASVTFAIDVDWVKADPLDEAVAYAAGSWRMGFVPRSGPRAGEAIRATGTFAETWHRGTDGTWRLRRDLTLTHAEG